MLYASLPEPFGRSVVCQFEADCALELFKLSRSHFNVEVVPLVGNLQDFRPRKPIDSEPVTVDKQARCAYSQHDVNAFKVLCRVQIDAVHCQFAGVVQIVELRFGWGLTSAGEQTEVSD